MAYGLFGKFSAHPGKGEELAGRLLDAARLLERNANCLHYVVGATDEPDAVWVWEAWTDKPSHDASLEAEDIRRLVGEARPLIAGVSDQIEVAIDGGKGLSG